MYCYRLWFFFSHDWMLKAKDGPSNVSIESQRLEEHQQGHSIEQSGHL